MDILNVKNEILLENENKKLILKEKEEKELTILEQENIIKNNHDEHEKKMNEVAKFNRLLEKSKQNQETYNKGPSESKVNELEKLKKENLKKSKELEGVFIKNQSQYIYKQIKLAETGK